MLIKKTKKTERHRQQKQHEKIPACKDWKGINNTHKEIFMCAYNRIFINKKYILIQVMGALYRYITFTVKPVLKGHLEIDKT